MAGPTTLTAAGEELRRLLAETEDGFVGDRYQTGPGNDKVVTIDGLFDLDDVARKFTHWAILEHNKPFP